MNKPRIGKFVFDKKPAPPRYAPGDRASDLEVVKVIGHMRNGTNRNRWWYGVKCLICGAVEMMSQDQLNARTDCKECAKRRGAARRKGGESMAPSGNAPNFLKMKW